MPVTEIDGRKIGNGKGGPVTRRVGEMLIREMEYEASNPATHAKWAGGLQAGFSVSTAIGEVEIMTGMRKYDNVVEELDNPPMQALL